MREINERGFKYGDLVRTHRSCFCIIHCSAVDPSVWRGKFISKGKIGVYVSQNSPKPDSETAREGMIREGMIFFDDMTGSVDHINLTLVEAAPDIE